MHKFILFKSSYFLTWNDYSKHIKTQSIQKVVHITISSQLLMLYSSGLKYNISKYQTWFSTHPGPFKTFKEKSLTLKNPQFSTPCTLQVVLTTIKNIRDISDRFNIVWCLNATWLYIFLPFLSLYKDQWQWMWPDNHHWYQRKRCPLCLLFTAPSHPQTYSNLFL